MINRKKLLDALDEMIAQESNRMSEHTLHMVRSLVRMMPEEEATKYGADDYQTQAMRTCSIPYADTKGLLYHAVFGLTSEAGEVAGILQKEYQGHVIDREHLLKELGDAQWMIAEACYSMGAPLSEVMRMNIEKLRQRYPDGFEAEKSLNRREGDI